MQFSLINLSSVLYIGSFPNKFHIKNFNSSKPYITRYIFSILLYGIYFNGSFKLAAGCDDIIRQHKAACLRVTALLACNELLWIGTSAGVLLTVPIPHIKPSTQRMSQPPIVIGTYWRHVRSFIIVAYCFRYN